MNQVWPWIQDRLLRGDQQDPKLRAYVSRLSARGLQTLAIVEIVGSLLLLFGRVAEGASPAGSARWWQTGSVMAVGAVTLGLARLRRGGAARLLGAASAWAAASLLLLVSTWQGADVAGADDYILAAITLVLITAAATLPLRPGHAFAMGMGVEGVYILFSRLSARGQLWPMVNSEPHHIFLVLLALLATGIAAVNDEHWRAEFTFQREAVRAAEALTGAQLRAQLAENAISVGKMAAALSHEINSPLGALRSSIQTLLAVTDRQIESPAEQHARLAATRVQLVRSIEESAARIDEVTGRLRRFVTLDEADVKLADLNELLSDVALLHQHDIQAAHVRLDLHFEKSLPPLNCRPQLLSAVFSTLLSNALHAVNGDGRIAIETRAREQEVEVTIRDNGRGMRPEEADTVFEPSFKVADGRVSSGNWSLFNSRQIVYEHGGDIRLETAEGQGTAVHVTLPVA